MKVMVAPLLTTKLYAPHTIGVGVTAHLIEQLRLVCARTFHVAAPAGFGKTTLLSEWLGHCDVPAAWFSVDEDDSDPAFLAYLSAALDGLAPSCVATGISLSIAGDPEVLHVD